MNIGFFDSGLGGLLVLKQVVKELPDFDYLYYGDTANLPFGDKTEAEIYNLTKHALDQLFKRDCNLVIVACNTVSAETLRKLQDTYLKENYADRRVLGVIIPTIEELVDSGVEKQALLLATTRTVNSRKYGLELNKLDRHIELTSVATPELVPLIESGKITQAINLAIKVIDQEIGEGEVVVLGCSHYILLKESLRAHYGEQLRFISQDEVIPYRLQNYLSRHPEIKSKISNTGKREIILSEHRPDYDRILADFLGGAYIAN